MKTASGLERYSQPKSHHRPQRPPISSNWRVTSLGGNERSLSKWFGVNPSHGAVHVWFWALALSLAFIKMDTVTSFFELLTHILMGVASIMHTKFQGRRTFSSKLLIYRIMSAIFYPLKNLRYILIRRVHRYCVPNLVSFRIVVSERKIFEVFPKQTEKKIQKDLIGSKHVQHVK